MGYLRKDIINISKSEKMRKLLINKSSCYVDSDVTGRYETWCQM